MERRLAAILAADVVGYTRLMGVDETGTLTSLKRVHSSTSPIAGLSGETGATPERDIPRRELNRLKPESQRRTVAMRVLMARWVLPMSCAIVLVTVTACDVGIEPTQETDAELYCRQGGFNLGSTAYADCVASRTQIAELADTPPGSSEAGAEEMSAEETTGGEMANEPSVQAQSDEPVEQETAALGNGQPEEAETRGEEVPMESANATETGSSEAQGAAESPDMAARESFAAHLSSVRTRDGTEIEWQRLQDLFPKPLDGKKLTVRTIEVAEQDIFYRVMAGPFDDYDKTQDLCSQLKASDQYCVVRRLSEDPSQ